MAFNWDALDIGNCELEHSQNYFDIRHIEHERLNEQTEEFLEKIIPRSKPIAIFKGKRLLDDFQTCDDQVKESAKPVHDKKSQNKPTTKSKPTVPVSKKEPTSRQPTIPRESRLTQYAETYAQKRKAMIEKYKKEQEEKNKPKRFRARSLPKYLKAQKAQKSNEENKENNRVANHEPNLANKRSKLRKSRSALEFK